MIYVDTSVALAHIFSEDRRPPDSIWDELLVSSRLLEYEMWNRLHARNSASTHGDHARDLMRRIAFLELAAPVLARALEPFPVPVRTLDALHLASIEFLQGQQQVVSLASYDNRMIDAARRMQISIAPI